MTLLLPILAALSVVIYTVYNFSTISSRINLIEISDDINITLLELRRYEKNIILFNEEESINKFYAYMDDIKDRIEGIDEEIIAVITGPNYDLLTKELETYKETAKPLIISVKAEQKLVEDIRPLGRMIEKSALNKQTALELRRHEKNYIIYKEQSAVDKLHGIAADLVEKQPSISRLVLNYLNAFNTLVTSESQKKTAVEKMRQAGRVIESITLEFSGRQRRAIDHTIFTSRKLLFGAFAFLMISTCALVYLFSKHVVKTLKAIEHSFDRLRAGDYTFNIDIRKSRAAEEIISFVDAYNLTITDLKKSREELELTLKRLGEANKELIERQDELVEAKKLSAMRLLASEIAHEINNPLSSLITFLGILYEDGQADNEKTGPFSLMLKEATRCQAILRELVDFARKEPLQIKEINPSRLIREAVEVVEKQHKGKNIKLVSHFNGLPERATLDPILIHQAVVNILTNAYQHTPEGGDIDIRGYTEGNNITIIIRDKGMGISAEDLPYIFEPFFSTRKDLGGSGLGLAITRKIIERHHGSIHVESRLGEETVFKISLPVNQER